MQARADFNLLSFFVRLEKQLIGAFFLLLLLGNSAIAQAAQRSRDRTRCVNDNCENGLLPSKETMAWRYNLFNEITSDPKLIPPNKIKGIKMGTVNRLPFRPTSCIQDKTSPLCQQEGKIVSDFYNGKEISLAKLKTEESRRIADKQFQEFLKTIEPKIVKISKNLNPTQKTRFNQLTDSLKVIGKFHFYGDAGKESQTANCLVYFALSLIEIMNKSIQSGDRTITVHRLKIGTEIQLKSETNQPQIIEHNHVTLLLDSNIQHEILIQRDAKAVQDQLAQIKNNEMNWDAWNGVLEFFKEDSAKMFGTETGWDFLHIQPITLDFTLLEGLSMNAVQFLCRAFAEIGLDVNPKNCEANTASNRPRR